MLKNTMAALMVLLAVSSYAADEYLIDSAHTQIGFKVKHMVVTTVQGKFNEFTGTVFYDEKDVTKSSVQGTIKVASIDTDNPKRDEHLRSADFFDAANFPEITFKSKKIVKQGDGLVAIGDMTIRGVTKEIKVPFTINGKVVDPWGKTRVGLDATASINRQDFGVSWNKTLDNGGVVVSNEVKIEINAEFIKK
jgi:polyisoprenoid-binding protein YceI